MSQPLLAVVGTMIDYDVGHREDGRPLLQRTARIAGHVNAGEAKVADIQRQLGRRPVLGAGNTAGDRKMLEWACAGDGPSLALLADHDDGDREFRYAGAAGTAAEAGPITDVARRLGCTVGEHGTGLAEDLPRPVVADAAGRRESRGRGQVTTHSPPKSGGCVGAPAAR